MKSANAHFTATVALTVHALYLIGFSSRFALADDWGGNRPGVFSSEYNSIYAKSVPAEDDGQKGTTTVFHVGADKDALVATYPWYSNRIYIGGEGEDTLIRVGPWQSGRKPEASHLALGIYRNGKTIKEYSTLEMEQMGSGTSSSVSRYTVFGHERPQFRYVGRGAALINLSLRNPYVFEIAGESGKVFQFSLETGEIVKTSPAPPAVPVIKTVK